VQFASDALAMPAASALAVIAAWAVTIARHRRWGCALVAAAGMTLGVAAAPGAVAAWTAESFSASARGTFAEFRSVVPANAELFWWDGLPETWFLVERRSFLSVSQLGGVVFSEALANEARRRASILEPLVPAGYWYSEPGVTRPAKLTRGLLTEICVAGGPDYVVSELDLGHAVARAEWPTRAKSRYLYACAPRPAQEPYD
jgi:hypothetical protein